ncbi:hypothetical protein CbuD7D7780_04065 [Coxiella burnetii]|uniref:Carboxypeptidase S1 n=1 Tax=Coxiella burnetii (strain Dugway 5J108-111) TaxID=434922 RepID=A9KDV9_COXBN|nr:carboxypeptidase S1 [Coxiella burnetii]ABS76914.1 carboxypeptidase S1 [Coxiella burnetii Dugway 5J108-111]OYK80544.1 hypothetical protein CbuD7E6568_04045 [Coxiella burnetii]OYK82628.1 hypothetical protein CbuD7D7780_04065 [Coxiella burnetii]
MKSIKAILFSVLLLLSNNLFCETSSFIKDKPTLPFKPTTTQHQIKLKTTTLSYHATVGVMPIYNPKKQLMATMSFIAYTADSKDQKRPITFIWAGGPGNASLSENFLVSGPQIIYLNSSTTSPKLVSNSETWLQFTDLVYIDMVGTGFGRANKKYVTKIFTPLGDAYTFSNFIIKYLQKYHRLNSPIYLSGESYGGFRAPLVVNNLLKQFIPIKGIILLSPVLSYSYQFSEFGDNTAYPLYIPTFIRTALYFHKLSAALQQNPNKTIQEGTQWSANQYPYYLLRGDSLDKQKRKVLVDQLSQYTGLSKSTIRNNNFRITSDIFRNELLKDINRNLDLVDARNMQFKINNDYGFYVFYIGTFMSSELVVYPHAMHYIFQTLGVKTSKNYINYFDPQQTVWNKGKMQQVISVLHDDLIINPKTKVFVGMGFYDLDFPYFATETAINQFLLPKELRGNISLHHYAGGHMFYIDPKVRATVFRKY